MLRPQDIMVLGWLALQQGREWRYSDMAQALGLSASESHAAVQRLLGSGLLLSALSAETGNPRLNHRACREFLVHGVPYVFYAERGPVTRGMPTGAAAPPLNRHIKSGDELPVWPDAEGSVRGYTLKPLYRSVPQAARRDAGLYAFLALLDALRDGRARERKLAASYLEKMLDG